MEAMTTTRKSKLERLQHANALIKVISDHGRRFFFNPRDNRVAFLDLGSRGGVYFNDDYRGARIYTNKTTFGNEWRGFSHGGTLKNLIEQMRDYILTGQQIPLGWIAPKRIMDGGGDMWGYGDDARQLVCDAASKLPIIATKE